MKSGKIINARKGAWEGGRNHRANKRRAGYESENSSCFGKMISAETKGAYKIKQPVDFQPYISKETIATTAEIN